MLSRGTNFGSETSNGHYYGQLQVGKFRRSAAAGLSER